MTPLARPLLVAACFAAGAAAMAQPAPRPTDTAQALQALAQARGAGEAARRRAEKLEATARQVSEQADRTAHEAAAVAARIQETQAQVAERQAQVAILARQQTQLRAVLAEKQAPIVRLTAALQRLSRRPPVLALFRPGSVRDTVYLRALLDTMLPEVERRTADLRAEIDKGRALERQQVALANSLRQSEDKLRARQQQLAGIESRQRLASRQASGIASRESDKALALAEKARDLDALSRDIAAQGELRDRLARLEGPVLRPPRPEDSRVTGTGGFDAPPDGLSAYILPVQGRLVSGFGEAGDGRLAAPGIVLAAVNGALAVAPAAGHVAFAGTYRGYGRIVIIEHAGGWTSLVTGLAKLDVEVGDSVVAGSPLGTVAPVPGTVTLELRRGGEPVNPLQYVKSL